MTTDIPALIYDNPLAVAVLTGLLIIAVYYMRTLSYRETVVAEFVKARAFVALNPVASRRGRPLIREAKEADYVDTLDATPREIVRQVRPPFQPNLLSTAKYRRLNGGRDWAHSQWAAYHGDGLQTHLMIYDNGNGRCDIYAHVESDVRSPAAHTDGDQRPGDADGIFREEYLSN